MFSFLNLRLCRQLSRLTGEQFVFTKSFVLRILPTLEPTLTFQPISDPTTEPTYEPTKDPTLEPTHDPTKDPTHEPTYEPLRANAEPTTVFK